MSNMNDEKIFKKKTTKTTKMQLKLEKKLN